MYRYEKRVVNTFVCVRIECTDIIRKLKEGLVGFFFVTIVDIGGNKIG